MPKHTTGPWKYRYTSAAEAKEPGSDGGGATGFIIAPTDKLIFGSDPGNVVAFLPHHRDISEDAERGANARLLASSPNMLHACKKTLPYIEQLCDIVNTLSQQIGDIPNRVRYEDFAQPLLEAIQEAQED